MARVKWDKVALVTGMVKSSERETILNAVRDGNAEVLVATTPTDEDLHPPPLRSLIVALGSNSRTRSFRGLVGWRPYPGEDTAIAFDIWNSAKFLYKQASQEEAVENKPYWRIEVVEMRQKRWLEMSSLSEGTQ